MKCTMGSGCHSFFEMDIYNVSMGLELWRLHILGHTVWTTRHVKTCIS